MSGAVVGGDMVDRSEALHRLHERSDLTWSQIAKLMGVTRGGVQHWASGTPMGDVEGARLRRICDVVDGLDGNTPVERYEAMMGQGRIGGRSLFDELRSELGAGQGRTVVDR
jgi:transcriptional regulator with XRE-family HTH domain